MSAIEKRLADVIRPYGQPIKGIVLEAIDEIEQLRKQLTAAQRERDEWQAKATRLPEETAAYKFAIDQGQKFQTELASANATTAQQAGVIAQQAGVIEQQAGVIEQQAGVIEQCRVELKRIANYPVGSNMLTPPQIADKALTAIAALPNAIKCSVCHGNPDLCDPHDCGDAHKAARRAVQSALPNTKGGE